MLHEYHENYCVVLNLKYGEFMFMLIKVPRGSIDEELAMASQNIETQSSPVYVPRLFLKLGLEIIRIAENNFNLDCGPTVGSDAAFSARNRASEDERAIAGWQDMRTAVYTAVSVCAQQHEKIFSEEMLEDILPDVAAFLQRELADIDLALLIGNFSANIGSTVEISSAAIKKLITANSTEPELEKFSAWVMQHEKIAYFRVHEVIAEYLQAYRMGIAQLKKARGRAPKNCV
jgi:hypothetical protein